MEGALRIQVIHVAGMFMVAQVNDGLSSRTMTEGVMSVEDMTPFLPLHLRDLQWSDDLLE